MIDAAILQVANVLNGALQRRFELAEQLVVVSAPYEPDGSLAPGVHNKLALFLVGIEHDTMPAVQAGPRLGMGRLPQRPVPVSLNLRLMFAAAFNAANYVEALKFVSGTIAFFQARPLLDHQNTPELDSRIDRLALDIENLGNHELGNLWGCFGGRYLPSVLYRMRLVTFDGQPDAQLPLVYQPITGAHP